MNRKISTNYIGRQIDLELLNGITIPEGQIKTTIGLGVTCPKIVTGIQKAIQQYVNLLLSELDTKKFESDIGGTIFSSVQKGVVNSSDYMTHIFNLANLNAFTVIKSDLQAIPYSVIPADERLTSATLLFFASDMIGDISVYLSKFLNSSLFTTLSTISASCSWFMSSILTSPIISATFLTSSSSLDIIASRKTLSATALLSLLVFIEVTLPLLSLSTFTLPLPSMSSYISPLLFKLY